MRALYVKADIATNGLYRCVEELPNRINNFRPDGFPPTLGN